MRKSLWKKLIDIERRTESENSMMATESDWFTLHRSVRCEVESVSAKEQSFQRRESVEKLFRLYCDPVDVTEKDRVVGKESPLVTGERYEIVGVNDWGDFFLLRLRLWQ